MKRSELKQIIKEVMLKEEKLTYQEMIDNLTDNKLVTIQLTPKSKRTGYLVIGGIDSLYEHLTTPIKSNIDALKQLGVKFGKCYINAHNQIKNDKWSDILTFDIFMTSKSGDELIYDKYEGNIAGFGQSMIYINSKEKMQLTQYIKQNDHSEKLDSNVLKNELSKLLNKYDFEYSIDLNRKPVYFWMYIGNYPDPGLSGDKANEIYKYILQHREEIKTILSKYIDFTKYKYMIRMHNLTELPKTAIAIEIKKAGDSVQEWEKYYGGKEYEHYEKL